MEKVEDYCWLKMVYFFSMKTKLRTSVIFCNMKDDTVNFSLNIFPQTK